MSTVFDKFVKMHGNFKVDANKSLHEEDFSNIYVLIESVSRIEMHELREKNEKSRQSLF